jgi:hypothetical protein
MDEEPLPKATCRSLEVAFYAFSVSTLPVKK